jgi:hypothetical protein
MGAVVSRATERNGLPLDLVQMLFELILVCSDGR